MTTTNRHQQIEQALTDLHHAGAQVSIAAIATHTGIARATLYRHPELIALINEHRAHTDTDLTLTALHTDIVHLRIGIEALAERVRHHEERLRSLERRHTTDTPN